MRAGLRQRLFVVALVPVAVALVALGVALAAAHGVVSLLPFLLIALACLTLATALAWSLARDTARSLVAVAELLLALARGRAREGPSAPVAALPPELAEVVLAANRLAESVQRAVEDARADRQRLLSVLERSADGMIAVDRAGQVAFLNAAARRLLDLEGRDVDAEIAQGRSLIALARDHELDALLRRCRQSGAQESGVIQLGVRSRAVEAIFLPLHGAAPWHYLGLLHDLTEVRRLEGQRRDFVSNVSHELRTPLASIRAVVEVLQDGALEDTAVAAEFVAGIDQEVDRLWQLVEELLELSRIESGQVPFVFASLDVARLCESAVRRLAPQAERAAVALTWSAARTLPPVRADQERLLRALMNLVHNAIKFTPAGGAVQVEARQRGAEVEIAVRDTGAGIAADDLDRIFERFYKADRARASSGTGLGLAIVKHTVQAHHGRVEVESAPGRGSTFRILLPIDGAAEPA